MPCRLRRRSVKVSQLSIGERYESKGGDEIREIISFVSDGTLRYITIPIVPEGRKLTVPRRRVYESTKQDFAKWATRKAGTSTHRSPDGMKFLNLIKGPTG